MRLALSRRRRSLRFAKVRVGSDYRLSLELLKSSVYTHCLPQSWEEIENGTSAMVFRRFLRILREFIYQSLWQIKAQNLIYTANLLIKGRRSFSPKIIPQQKILHLKHDPKKIALTCFSGSISFFRHILTLLCPMFLN